MSAIAHEGLSKEQFFERFGGRGGQERDLGSVDSDLVRDRSASEPTVVNVGWLPSVQPLCPMCFTALHVVRQNHRGDSLFECLQPCEGDGYMAVYRASPPAWEHYQGRYGADRPAGWLAPVRLGDVPAIRAARERAAGQAQAAQAPTEAPRGTWPGETAPAAPAAAPVTAEDALAALGFGGEAKDPEPTDHADGAADDSPATAQAEGVTHEQPLSKSQAKRLKAQRGE